MAQLEHMRIIDYRRLRPVWAVRQEYKLSASATLLQFALMEFQLLAGDDAFFSASTSEIRLLTGLSESAIKVARKQLIEHGILEYQPGKNKMEISQYRLLGGKNKPLSEPLKQVNPAYTTLLNKNIYSLRERNRNNSHSKEELRPIGEFNCLASDTEWINRIISWIKSSIGIQLREEDVKSKYAEFLCYLSASGQIAKTESDMKSHFSNWLKKEMKENKRSTEDVDPTILRTNNISKFKSGEGW